MMKNPYADPVMEDLEQYRKYVREFLNTSPDEHVRRIKSTYTEKIYAMFAIEAVLGCDMEEAYRLYDECKVEPPKNKTK